MKSPSSRFVSYTAGIASVVLGMIVIVGWYTGVAALVQLHPALAAMQFNTATCFVVAGTGLIALVQRRPRVVLVCVWVLVGVGLLTLGEYAFGVDFLIDQLLHTPRVTTVVNPYPGRMGPNTAACFVLVGGTLWVLIAAARFKYHLYAAVALTYGVLVLAASVLLAYVGSLVSNLGWGLFTQMAVHTASGFLTVAIGLLAAIDSQRLPSTHTPEERTIFGVPLGASVAWVTLFMGLALTTWAWYATVVNVAHDARVRFDDTTERMTREIGERARDYRQILFSARGLFVASSEVERKEWRRYFLSLETAQRFPSLEGIGFVRRITPAQKTAHIRAVRAEGFPTYDIRPSAVHAEYYPIVFIEPFDASNRRTFGYDMFSDPTRRAAMEQARDTAQPVASSKLRPQFETDENVLPGFLMFLPVYRGELTPTSIEQRRAQIYGFVYTPFRVADFVSDVLGDRYPDIALQGYFGTDNVASALVYETPRPDAEAHYRSAYTGSRAIILGGKTWTLSFSSRPRFDRAISTYQPLWVLIGGALSSLLLFGIAWSLSTTWQRAMTLAMSMTVQLRESEQRFRQVADNIHEVFFLVDSALTKMFYVSPAYEEIWGRTCASLYANPQSWADAMHADDRERVFREIAPQGTLVPFDVEYRIVRSDGTLRWIRARGFPIANDVGESFRFAGIAEDITERKEQQNKIARLTRIYAVLSGINSAIVRIRDREELFAQTCRIAVTEGAFRMAWIGTFDAETLEGKVVASYGASTEYLEKIKLNARADSAYGHLPGGRAVREKKVIICNDVATDPSLAPAGQALLKEGASSGGAFPLIVNDQAVAVLGLFSSEVGFFDEQELKLLNDLADDVAFGLQYIEKEEKLGFLAYYDTLTGLANRRLLLDRMHQAIVNAKRGGYMVGVAFLDLDHFKFINDSLGHEVGDEMLKIIAARLTASVRESDTVARLGGDEFVVLLPAQAREESTTGMVDSTSTEMHLADLMQRILGNISQPMVLAERDVTINCSIGLSVYPQDGTEAEILLRNADTALYRTKELGRNNFQFFTPDMHERAQKRMSLESGLKLALERDEFELHYQPQVDLRNGKIIGMEALLRWRHPQQGLMAPSQFIGLAEESGLIIPIGEWALARACAQNRAWQDQGLAPIPIAVNMSARQCAQQNIDTVVRDVLQATRLPPQFLELELTESISMNNPEKMIQLMGRLKDMGVKLSIDDFGTGYSSMSYLKRFPLDKLKLDISFVREITTDPNSLAISEAIITLAHSLRLRVVAEGVETEGQLTLLASRKCDEIQGYFFSRPLPADDVAKLLFEDRRLPAEVIGRKEGGPALLILDDDHDVISLFQSLLVSDDRDLLLTSSVTEAFEMLARHEVGVVICDQRMPQMSGVEFLSKVRGMYPDTIRVLMSAHEDFEATREAINRGAVYKFLGKPWEHEELKAMLEGAFRRYRKGTGLGPRSTHGS